MNRPRVRSLVVAAAIVLAGGFACGGGDGSPGTPSPGPGPGPGTPPAINPCDAVAEEAASAAARALDSDKRGSVWGDTRWSWLDHAWTSRTASGRRAAGEAGVSPLDRDVGNVAVIQDNGQIVLPANRFDLAGRGVRFRPNAGGGYDVSPADAGFRSPLGTRLTLTDDDATAVTVAFAFPIGGGSRNAAFVNSDGNVTFDEGDTASTARNVTRFLEGPPRVAPFFADLDPSAGGSVWVNAAADAFVVTWCAVPGFESEQKVTAQTTLLPDGTVDVKIADTTNLTDAVVGVSPGRTRSFSPADLSGAGQTSPAGAVGERFTRTADIDLQAAARRFYASHPDNFDQLVFWTDTRVVSDAFAYETTVKNNIRGLGIDQFDESRQFGSRGRLSSVLVMDTLTKYPSDPRQRFLGENNTVSVLGQETGHRWLVFLEFRDVNRRVSDALLGRDDAHWSFFVDSDASVMEGNDIEDRGGGSFRTVGAVARYSRVDLYAMGLLAENDVPPFFYVENPVNTRPDVSGKDAAPRVGVTFNGTRRNVRLQDIIDAVGRRQPSAAGAPKLWRQSFVYIVGGGRAVDEAQVAKLERIRSAWESFYGQAVGGRGKLEARVR